MSEYPSSWSKVHLGNLLQLNYGKSLPARSRSGEGYPVYGSNGVVGSHTHALTTGETLVIGRKGSVGEVNLSSEPCFPIDTTYYIDQLHGMPAKYWLYHLQYLRLHEFNNATAIPGINRNDVYHIKISLPPLREQERIVDKLDSLLTRIDVCRDRLNNASRILGRFRQSVLAAATSGKLTADWRALDNIDSQKKKAKNVEFGSFEYFKDFEFPDSWETARLEEISEITGGITKNSKRKDLLARL